jgi:hypothetical protein
LSFLAAFGSLGTLVFAKIQDEVLQSTLLQVFIGGIVTYGGKNYPHRLLR